MIPFSTDYIYFLFPSYGLMRWSTVSQTYIMCIIFVSFTVIYIFLHRMNILSVFSCMGRANVKQIKKQTDLFLRIHLGNDPPRCWSEGTWPAAPSAYQLEMKISQLQDGKRKQPVSSRSVCVYMCVCVRVCVCCREGIKAQCLESCTTALNKY